VLVHDAFVDDGVRVAFGWRLLVDLMREVGNSLARLVAAACGICTKHPHPCARHALQPDHHDRAGSAAASPATEKKPLHAAALEAAASLSKNEKKPPHVPRKKH
jgi:hypothetical protein